MTNLPCSPYKDGCILNLKIIANAKATKIQECLFGEESVLKVHVASKPEAGKANQELLKFLAKELSLSAKDLRIIAGATVSRKLLYVPCSPEKIMNWLVGKGINMIT